MNEQALQVRMLGSFSIRWMDNAELSDNSLMFFFRNDPSFRTSCPIRFFGSLFFTICNPAKDIFHSFVPVYIFQKIFAVFLAFLLFVW